MPHSMTYHSQGFHAKFEGVISGKELEWVNSKIYEHPEFDSHRYQVIDLLDADMSALSEDDTESIAASDFGGSLSRGEVKVALVASNKTTIALCEQYKKVTESLSSTWQVRIFSDFKQANSWINP